MRRWTIVLSLAVLAGVTLTACQSSQDKAKEIQAQAVAAAPKPLVIPKPNKDVKVLGTTVLHDQNGDAVVVEVQNETNQTLVDVPILIDIKDAKGKTIYKNDTAGLDFALNHIAVLEPHQTFAWVNDQVQPSGIPKSGKAVVGEPESKPPAKLPELVVSPPRLGHDISGAKVTGTVTNRSGIDQSQLVLFAVARSGGRIVAAGRGLIKKSKVGAQPAPYVIFFIGNPTGDVTIQAPPTVLQ